jgi:PAS domain S-box-containing protein
LKVGIIIQKNNLFTKRIIFMDRQNSMNESHHEFRRRSDIDKNNARVLTGDDEFRVAIESTGLGIIDYYPLSGELYWNNAAKDHFGLSPDAQVNYNVFLVGLHPEDRERIELLFQNSLEPISEGDFRAAYRTVGIEDGKERRIEMRGKAFFNRRGEAVRFIGTTLDLSECKQEDTAS